MKFEVDDRMIIYAFRYAIGKPMLFAEPCANWIKFHWKNLPHPARDQIRREIMVFIERGEAGGSNEILMWFNLYEEVKSIQ